MRLLPVSNNSPAGPVALGRPLEGGKPLTNIFSSSKYFDWYFTLFLFPLSFATIFSLFVNPANVIPISHTPSVLVYWIFHSQFTFGVLNQTSE
jgi:hypothetical protein